MLAIFVPLLFVLVLVVVVVLEFACPEIEDEFEFDYDALKNPIAENRDRPNQPGQNSVGLKEVEDEDDYDYPAPEHEGKRTKSCKSGVIIENNTTYNILHNLGLTKRIETDSGPATNVMPGTVAATEWGR